MIRILKTAKINMDHLYLDERKAKKPHNGGFKIKKYSFTKP